MLLPGPEGTRRSVVRETKGLGPSVSCSVARAEYCIDKAWRQDRIIEKAHDGRGRSCIRGMPSQGANSNENERSSHSRGGDSPGLCRPWHSAPALLQSPPPVASRSRTRARPVPARLRNEQRGRVHLLLLARHGNGGVLGARRVSPVGPRHERSGSTWLGRDSPEVRGPTQGQMNGIVIQNGRVIDPATGFDEVADAAISAYRAKATSCCFPDAGGLLPLAAGPRREAILSVNWAAAGQRRRAFSPQRLADLGPSAAAAPRRAWP